MRHLADPETTTLLCTGRRCYTLPPGDGYVFTDDDRTKYPIDCPTCLVAEGLVPGSRWRRISGISAGRVGLVTEVEGDIVRGDFEGEGDVGGFKRSRYGFLRDFEPM